jgi:hypothetical protein
VAVTVVTAKADVEASPNVRNPTTAAGNADFIAFENFMAI